MAVSREQARKLCGKRIYAVKKDGSVIRGKLLKIQGQRLFLAPDNGKKVRTKGFVLPLVLFDLLAIGVTSSSGCGIGGPFGFGGPFNNQFGGFGGFPGFFR
ncbi:hypothetical protein [Paenibacillus sp. GCM10027626]|uniref:hypothetical protein n=1 Tax=Paenibacillus sp. GCM10027626 TaxID=3273411 RepID=UPI0036416A1A